MCLLATVAIVGCDLFGSDDDDDTVISGSYATISGKIVDLTGNVITSAFNVSGGNKTLDTDTGSFKLENATIDATGKIILTISGAGYLNNYAVEAINAGQTVIATYTMRAIPANGAKATYDLTADVTASQTTTKVTTQRAKIDLKAGSVLNSDGTSATSAEITVVHTMPKEDADAKPLDIFPGIFAGVPTDSAAEVPFETFGFVYVDLGTDANGKARTLDKTKPAKLIMPIDPTMLAKADATIKLWSYDTTKGQWIQEGTATKVGNNYEAEVTHFSWYNLDRPFDAAVRTLKVTVASYTYTFDHENMGEEGSVDTNKTDLSKRVANAKVIVTATLDSSSTDGEGFWTANNAEGYPATDVTTTWKEVSSTNSSGEATFTIPSGRRIAIEVVAEDGSRADGYGYEITDSVASAFVNLGGYID
jgi:hypothetical protein